jgi:hypothetical protein
VEIRKIMTVMVIATVMIVIAKIMQSVLVLQQERPMEDERMDPISVWEMGNWKDQNNVMMEIFSIKMDAPNKAL